MKLRSKPMTKEQIKQYLHKLQLENFTPRADLATLQKLHDAHLKYIPYDNFDCLNSKITSLRRDKMFDKLILHNRGGICFELNGCTPGCSNRWGLISSASPGASLIK